MVWALPSPLFILVLQLLLGQLQFSVNGRAQLVIGMVRHPVLQLPSTKTQSLLFT